MGSGNGRAKTVASVACLIAWLCLFAAGPAPAADPGVAVLLVDTDRVAGTIDERIYGQFLEEINHSVVDGLYAEQVRGQGFEGKDFADYWTPFGTSGEAALVATAFERGEKSVRLTARAGTAGIRQGRLYVEAGEKYDGSLWLDPEQGTPAVSLRIVSAAGRELAKAPLKAARGGWQEVPFELTSAVTDRQASLEIVATGTGSVLVDFVSLMRASARKSGKLRPDLLAALKGLAPPFIRWPGGSYASIYKWKDGIGPAVSRRYNPNTIWGGYSDYYGFGTDEFLELCRQLGAAPMIVLAATSTDPAQLQYALEWVHYLVDPPSTEWGRRRAANGHPEPYRVPYIQIDNEPMNHELSPDQYAAIVNLYGPRLREIAPQSKVVACGQKRSNDMNWSEKLIDLAGQNFDILGVHNYEYEPENYATGVRRIEDYLEKLIEYVRRSAHPGIEVAVLEWGASRTYDWRAGLHAAGSLLSYEKLSPALAMSSPALLMRNTTDDPEWRSWIYHDHVSWFAGSGYVAEKLFREYYAPRRHAFTSGTFKDIPRREEFFDKVSQMKPEDWTPNTVDAIATSSADGRRFILKAVNYDGTPHTLLTRFQGSRVPASATVKVVTLTAGLDEANSLAEPDKLRRVEATKPYQRDMAFDLPPYTVAVIEIRATPAAQTDARPAPSAGEVGARRAGSDVTSPEVAPDRRVTFRLRAPEAKAVKVSGDFGADADMRRSEDGVWSVTVGPLDPEMYVYFFTVDGVRLTDPGNPQVKIGYVTTTTTSLLTVPGDRPAFYDVQDVPHGEIRTLLYESRSNGVARELTVYVPPGYDAAPRRRYPVLYLLHGFANDHHSWHRYGRANDILDNLLAQRAIAPFLVVMPLGYGGASVNGDGTGIARLAAEGARGDPALYERDLLEDIIPMIDGTYRTLADRKHRAIIGFSMGGGQAGRFGLRHLETFSEIGIMSAGLGGGGAAAAASPDPIAELAADPVKANERIDLLWIACGKDDAAMQGARTVHQALEKAGIEHTFLETEGAHHWRVWRRYLRDVAPLLFKNGPSRR